MMQINLARAGANELAEQRSHARHVFRRVLPVVAALSIAGNLAYHACFPRRVEITPDVCKNVPAKVEKPDPEELALKAKEMAGCPPLEEIERRLYESGYLREHLKCVGYEMEDGGRPTGELMRRIETFSAHGASSLEDIRDYLKVFLESAKRGIYTDWTDKRVAYALHSAIAMHAEDEAKFEKIRQMVIEYAGTRYDTYPNPLTEFMKNNYFGRLARDGYEKRVMYGVLLEAMVRCTENSNAAEAPVRLFSSEGGMKANLEGACGFQAKASTALSRTLRGISSMMGQEDAENAEEILWNMETVVVGSEYWKVFMKNAAGSAGDDIYLDARFGAEESAWPYHIIMHETMHYLAGHIGGGINNFVFNELLTDALATRAINIQIGIDDSISEQNGEVSWNGIFFGRMVPEYDMEFYRLLMLFEREMGRDGIMGAYLHGNLQAFRSVMEREYGNGAFEHVFGESGYLRRVLEVIKNNLFGGSTNKFMEATERLIELRENKTGNVGDA